MTFPLSRLPVQLLRQLHACAGQQRVPLLLLLVNAGLAYEGLYIPYDTLLPSKQP
ncbi:hypothetical protein M1B34_16940 [Pseudomonas sp. MAFF 302030]|uniref:Uncharacterized protein n=1 Tax=Pseudomonas morbosilactucae TaxID=2938197 RepID=A0A9X1YXC4_9PSED|nr:hypothetical protein [Pseudomonas morbosilactucae]MCK9799346.1 hypothetical protein [Pseudomonas morbosilactucae]MCK9812674.1 hypothetical protein [Pseudomonas morbosilactucae]WEK07585.1 MAG: hypothetical protein P0Y51_20240 [Pseudomonas sp.]